MSGPITHRSRINIFKEFVILGNPQNLIFIRWYQSRERIPERRKKNVNRSGKRYNYVKVGEFMQMAVAEGEKICSNLEDAKRPSAEGLVRYHVTEEAVTAEVGCTEGMQWLKLLRTRRSI